MKPNRPTYTVPPSLSTPCLFQKLIKTYTKGQVSLSTQIIDLSLNSHSAQIEPFRCFAEHDLKGFMAKGFERFHNRAWIGYSLWRRKGASVRMFGL